MGTPVAAYDYTTLFFIHSKFCPIKSKCACFTGTYIVCKRSENWFFRFWCQLSPLALCFWRPNSLSYLHQLNDKTLLDMILSCFPRLIPKLCWKKQSWIFWTSSRWCSHSSGCWAEGLREQWEKELWVKINKASETECGLKPKNIPIGVEIIISPFK